MGSGESHSCKELIQTKRSTTKKTPCGPVCPRRRKTSQRMRKARIPAILFKDIRVPSARCHTESVKRGDRPCWTNNATKWRQWSISIKTKPSRKMKVSRSRFKILWVRCWEGLFIGAAVSERRPIRSVSGTRYAQDQRSARGCCDGAERGASAVRRLLRRVHQRGLELTWRWERPRGGWTAPRARRAKRSAASRPRPCPRAALQRCHRRRCSCRARRLARAPQRRASRGRGLSRLCRRNRHDPHRRRASTRAQERLACALR